MVTGRRIAPWVVQFPHAMPPPSDSFVLVLGASRGIGGEATPALAHHDWHVRALIRDPQTEAARRQFS